MSQAMHRRSDDQEGLTHLDWVNEDLPRLGHENLIEHCRLSTRWASMVSFTRSGLQGGRLHLIWLGRA